MPLSFVRPIGALFVMLASLTACGSDPTVLAIDTQAVPPVASPVATTEPLQIPTLAPTATAVPGSLDAPLVDASQAQAAATATPVPSPTIVVVPDPTPVPTPVPSPVTATATPVDDTTAQDQLLATATATTIEQQTPTTAPTVEVPTSEPSAVPTAVASNSERLVSSIGYAPLGVADGVNLVLPVAKIELVGFHEAGHPGSKAIDTSSLGVPSMVLETRYRGTSSSSAADIVVPPGEVVVAPVTGTVVSAGSYVLYCEHPDALVYIEPDGRPNWQVRLFHVTDVAVAVGDRVIAGETLVASGARMLPFESQIDEFTGAPSWPHVHLEVVDKNIVDTRPPGPGC